MSTTKHGGSWTQIGYCLITCLRNFSQSQNLYESINPSWFQVPPSWPVCELVHLIMLGFWCRHFFWARQGGFLSHFIKRCTTYATDADGDFFDGGRGSFFPMHLFWDDKMDTINKASWDANSFTPRLCHGCITITSSTQLESCVLRIVNSCSSSTVQTIFILQVDGAFCLWTLRVSRYLQ